MTIDVLVSNRQKVVLVAAVPRALLQDISDIVTQMPRHRARLTAMNMYGI